VWSPRVQTWHAGLSAQRLLLAKPAGVWPGRPAACHRIGCAPGVEGGEPWRPAVTALAQWLAENGGRKPALHIVLSGRFVRWQLLPWRAELSHPKELAAYASLRFRETFGKPAEDWQVLHSPQPPGMTVPACAVDAALLAALRSTCDTAGAGLVAVTPYFAAAFDRWRRVLGKKTLWFGLIEADCVSLGLLRNGHWLGLRSQRADADWREALPGMMAQLGVSAGLSEASPPLYLAGSGEPPAPVAGLAFTWLQPKAQAQRAMADCRMAWGI
jgi:hypothetical protein